MDPVTIAMLSMAAVSTISSLWGGISGKSDAKSAAAEEARLEGFVTAAKLEDLHKDEEQMRGQTIAAAAGSNVKVGVGSPLEILSEQAREFQRERFTVQHAGATRAAQAKSRGRMAGNTAMWQGVGQAAGTAANAFSMFRSMNPKPA